MAGSLDDHNVEIVDTRDALLAVLVMPSGEVRLQCYVTKDDGTPDHAWVADVLRQVADAQEKRAL